MSRFSLAPILEFAIPAALLTLWWFASGERASFYFPALSEILQVLWDSWLAERMLQDVLPSVLRLLLGYFLAIFIGVGLGVALGLSRTAAAFWSAVLDFLRSMPSVALIPFAILVFGIDTSMKVFVITFGALWPILLNTIDGVRGVDKQMLEMADSFRLSRRDLLLRLILPAASPQIFTGMRASLSIGIIMMVVSEMLASSDGIGFAILQAQRSFATKEMWAGLFVLAALGYLLNLAFGLIEARMMRWHRGLRRMAAKT
ncbi:MAG: ABC transporter permease [Burkholderiales bacterium]|nr:ABC transporter permease [Burkholderiales bacterium]